MENLMKCVPCKLKESEFCAECTSKTQDSIKTMAEWNVKGVDFTKYVEDYDEIDEELYECFTTYELTDYARVCRLWFSVQ